MSTTIQLSRRRFLQGSLGALTLAVTAGGLVTIVRAADADSKKYGADSMPGGTVDDPLVFVSIAEDGTVTAPFLALMPARDFFDRLGGVTSGNVITPIDEFLPSGD